VLPESKTKIIDSLRKEDRVLDVGGWENPFPLATHIMDICTYETRKGNRTGERFSKNTWVTRDICNHEPWPYKDKEFDFVICSHLLEDVRDPLWVCSEMQRVGKAGYIETPSRGAESVMGRDWASPFREEYAGFWHHRWFVEIKGDGLVFIFKSPLVSLKAVRVSKCLDGGAVAFFWRDAFPFRERFVFDTMDFVKDQLDFIESHGGKPPNAALAVKLRFGILLSKSSFIRKLYTQLKRSL
jgi:hypothetical protein